LARFVAGLLAENAELRRRLGMTSRNSSIRPSEEAIAAKAGRNSRRAADRCSRERSPDRKPGGQPGHKGSGLTPAAVPDRTETR
jgi:transposase